VEQGNRPAPAKNAGMLSGSRTRRRRRAALAVLPALALLAAAPVAAQAPGDDYCLTTEAPEPSAPAHPIDFGITPLTAGNVGAVQGDAVPLDPERDLAALRGLTSDPGALVMRLNRMFWADGEPGVQRYAALVDQYAEAGFPSELQVRYHPPSGAEGDLDAWEEYVRLAARVLGERRSVTALSITNEANFTASANTSDGGYEGVREAIVRGTLAARDELDRIGRPDVRLGFSFAWRWAPHSDREFWEELGRLATPEFLAATDYVGLQIYPHLVWPPAPLPGRSLTREVVEPLTLMRDCYLPRAGLQDVDLWVTENGYATNLGRTEESQEASLRETVEALHRWSGTLGVTDYRWFNLRDNRSTGTDLFDAVGLLRDDYTEKPAYAAFAELLAAYGTGSGTPSPAPDPAAAEHSDAPASAARADGLDVRALPATGAGPLPVAAAGLAVLGVVGTAAARRRATG
jgi:hypothetical protein